MNLVEGSIDLEGDPPRIDDDMAERVAAMMELIVRAVRRIEFGYTEEGVKELGFALRIGMFGVEKDG